MYRSRPTVQRRLGFQEYDRAMPVPAIFQVRSLETDELFDVDACNAHTLEERAGGETSQTGISRLLAHSRLNAEGELSDPNDAVRADARTQAKLVQKVLPIQGVRGSRGGEGGIRTHDTVARMPHFECGAFNRSATSPRPKGRAPLGGPLCSQHRKARQEKPRAGRPFARLGRLARSFPDARSRCLCPFVRGRSFGPAKVSATGWKSIFSRDRS
jgi:hypothetical protein